MSTFGQFLDGRDDASKADAKRRELAPDWTAPKTKAPDAMVEELLALINVTFYATADAKAYLRDNRELKLALTWPATWLSQRGVGLPVDRYEKLLRDIIGEIKQHGDMAAIRHFPTYFKHVVTQWFIHNGEQLYEERKHVRNLIDMRLLQRAGASAPAPDPTETLATLNRMLATRKRAAKAVKNDEPELPLL